MEDSGFYKLAHLLGVLSLRIEPFFKVGEEGTSTKLA